MEHSKNFQMVKGWYDNGRPIVWIKNAVKKNFITEDEFYEITGIKYEA